jgi:hypothetical protein
MHIYRVLMRPLLSQRLVCGVAMLLFVRAQPEFYRVCHTKAQYDEEGPRIARKSPVFSTNM